MRNKRSVILIQPQMGLSGEFSRHLPLSLLYVAAALKKLDIGVKILDTRVIEADWRCELQKLIADCQPLRFNRSLTPPR